MFRKHDLFTNLLNKRCVFVLLDFCSNSFNIHPCNIHKRSLQWQRFLISDEALRPDATKIHYIDTNKKRAKDLPLPAQKARGVLPWMTTHLTLGSDSHSSRKLLYFKSISVISIKINQLRLLFRQIELISEPDTSSQSQFEFSNIIPKGQSSPNKTDVT